MVGEIKITIHPEDKMTTPWERFKQAARLEEPDQVPV